MKTALFDYHLPQELIAQQPAEPRDASRLLVLERETGAITHCRFRDIGDYLHAGDLLIANDSRVIPARLLGRKPSGGRVELFLLRSLDDLGSEWEALVRGRNLVEGVQVHLDGAAGAPPIQAEMVQVLPAGTRLLRFNVPLLDLLDQVGEVPLPP